MVKLYSLFAVALILGACSTNRKVSSPSPDPIRSTLTADRTTGLLANGSDNAVITLSLVNAQGQALSGVQVAITATGDGAQVTTAPSTDANGKSVVRLSSSAAGVKLVVAKVIGGPTLTHTLSIEFISGPGTKLSFLVPPSSAQAGSIIAPPVQVAIEDSFGNLVPTDAGPQVSLTLSQDGGTQTLNGMVTVSSGSDGIAKFDGLSILQTGRGFALIASATGLATAVSSSFDITAGPPAALSFSSQPSGVVMNNPIAPAITVRLNDAQGNLDASGSAVVSMALSSGCANASGTAHLSGTLSQTASGGVATFADLSIDRATSGCTLVATASGYAGVFSAPFDVNPGAPCASTSTLVATPPSQRADGLSTVNLAIALHDCAGDPVSGEPLVLSASGSGNHLQLTSGETSAGGTFATGLTSTNAGNKTVTASVGSADAGFTLTADVTFTPGVPSASTSTISVTPQVIADGISTATISIVARDLSGNLFPGAVVQLSASGHENAFASGADGGDGSIGATDATGQFTGELVSTRAETKVVTATFGEGAAQATLTAVVTFVPGAASASASQLVASPNNLTADGTTTTTLQLLVADLNGNPIDEAPVSLSASGTGNSFQVSSGRTNVGGLFTTSLSSTVAQRETISAAIGDGAAISVTTQVTFNAPTIAQEYETLIATASSVIANGSASTTLQVTIVDASGNPVSNRAVALVASGSGGLFASGMSSGSSIGGNTDVNGSYTARLSSTKAGVVVVTALSGALSASTPITFLAGPASAARSSLSATPSSLPTGGTTSLLVQLVDANDNPLEGAAVTLSADGAGNTFTARGATGGAQLLGSTSSGGIFSAQLSASKAETENVLVALTGAAQPLLSVPVSFVDPVIVPSLTFKSSSTQVVADGHTKTTLTATVLDQFGNGISGRTVTVAASGSANTLGHAATTSTNGSLSSTTGADGTCAFTLSSTHAETKVVTASTGVLSAVAAVAFVAGAPIAGHSSITVNPSSALVNDSELVEVILNDANDNPVQGQQLTLSAAGTGNQFTVGGVTASTASGNTGTSGLFRATLSSSVAQTEAVNVILAGASSALVSGPATFTLAPVTLSLALTSSLSSVVADGSATTTISATVQDNHGNAVSGQAVSVNINGSANTLTSASGSTTSNTISGSTNSSGVFSATLSSTRAEAKIVSANAGPLNAATSVTFVPGAASAARSSISISPASLLVGSSASVLVVLSDANGNSVSGQSLALAASGSGNTFSPAGTTSATASGQTNAGGIFTATISSATAQSEMVSVTLSGASSALVSAPITFTSTPVTLSLTLTSSSSSVVADGTSTTTLTATVLDNHGNAVSGQPVTLGANGSANTFTAGSNHGSSASGTTNASGVFTATLSSTRAGTEVVTAASAALTASTAITFVAGPANAAQSSITSSPSSVATGATISLIVVLADANGNPISGQAITLSGSGSGNNFTLGSSTGSVATGTTNAGGLAVATVTSSTAQSETVSVTVGGAGQPLLSTTVVFLKALQSITIAPSSATVANGKTQQFTATGHYSDGTSQTLSSGVLWNVGTPAVATMVGSGLVQGSSLGSSEITAAVGNISGSATLTVSAATLQSISVSPADASIPNGKTQQFAATGTYSDGTTQPLNSGLAWSSDTHAVATINSGGVATAHGGGLCAVTATTSGISGSTTLTVTAATLQSITLSPSDSEIVSGQSEPLVATGHYSDGSSLTPLVAGVLWNSSSESIASVSTSGTVTGVATGVATIYATLNGITGSASVTTLLAPPTGLTAAPIGGGVTLNWNQEAGALSYTVYVSSNPGVTPTRFQTSVSGISAPYTVTGLQNGAASYFVVTANGALGEGGPSTQIAATPNTVIAVASGEQGTHVVSLLADGTVWTWGSNSNGQLGNGVNNNNADNDSDIPVQVLGAGGKGVLKHVVAISAGSSHTVALTSDGTVWAWGSNSGGELGNGSNNDSPFPVQAVGVGGNGVLGNVVSICAGTNETIALSADGTVWAWGWNGNGQLGNGATLNSNLPTQVVGSGGTGALSNVIAIAAGTAHAAALRADGTVWTWGAHGNGALGNGSLNDSSIPVQVLGVGGTGVLSGVTAIAAGQEHTVALTADGSIFAWGLNGNGQLGNGSTVSTNTPVLVLDAQGSGVLGGAVGISAGNVHTIALLSDDTVWTWGSNGNGQLGDGLNDNNSNNDSSIPVQVLGAGGSGFTTNATSIAAGDIHSVALESDGTVWAWGSNSNGQLGDGLNDNNSNNDSTWPVASLGSNPSWLLSPTGLHATPSTTDLSIALSWNASDGATGYNVYGSSFADVSPLTGTLLARVSETGFNHTGLRNNTLYYYVVTAVGGATETTAAYTTQARAGISAPFATVIGVGGGSVTVGWNAVPHADSYNLYYSSSSGVSPSNGTLVSGVTSPYTLAGLSNGQPVYIVVSALNAVGESPSAQVVAIPNTVIAIAGGESGNHTVSLLSDGTVWAWGSNSNGQLGNHSNSNSAQPIQVLDATGTGVLSNAIVVAAGYSHSLALKSDGTVWAWGGNQYGQLGNGSSDDSSTPVQVQGEGGKGALSGMVATAAGAFHTVALKSDGTVWAWGSNSNGALGNSSNADSSTPVQVLGTGGVGVLSGVISIAAGLGHSVALKSDGTVWAWGYNGSGQLGDGSTTDRYTPVQVLGAGGTGIFNGAIALAAGAYDTVALRSDGSVWTWGYNSFGQLGDNSTDDSLTPVQVVGVEGTGNLTGIVAIASGEHHTVALDASGSVWSWGWNATGQLGNGSGVDSNTPVQVLGTNGKGVLSGVDAITATAYDTVALKSDGTVCAWGYNSDGELGNGSTTPSETPVPSLLSNPGWLLAPAGLTAIPSATSLDIDLSWTASAGATVYNIYGSMFADVSPLNGTLLGTVSGTSFNHTDVTNGARYYYVVTAIGNATETTGSYSAEAVAGLAAPSVTVLGVGGGEVSVGWNSIPGATSYNLYYSTSQGVSPANGTRLSGVTSPYTLTGLANGKPVFLIVSALSAEFETPSAEVVAMANAVVAIAGGEEGSHTVSLKSDGTVWAWGANAAGQLGNGTTTDSGVPVQALGSGGIGLLDGVVSIAVGGGHTVALKSDGTVWTYGWNINGQLGNNSTGNSDTPVQVLGAGGAGFLSGVVAISASNKRTVALKLDGTVWAWGSNQNGQLGNGTTNQSNVPVQVVGSGGAGVLSDVVAIAAGGDHTVALKSDGTVWAWGGNWSGQLGDNTVVNRYSPVQVKGNGASGVLSGIVGVAAGYGHSVALGADGTVWEWGYNFYGQLGNNSTSDRHTPVQVLGTGGVGILSGVVAIATGSMHTVALKGDGTVWAWGWNQYGQLGNNSTIDSQTPVQVQGSGGRGVLSGVVSISAGLNHTIALKSDGTVCDWGDSTSGELGNGSNNQSSTPVGSLVATPSWLLSPTGLTATASTTSLAVSLSWTASSGATAYNVYESTHPDVSPLNGTLVTTVSGTSFNHDTNLINGTRYYYVVTAVGGATESTPSLVATAQSLLVPPTLVVLTVGGGDVVVGWNSVFGASSYNLYYSAVSGVTPANGTRISGVTSPYPLTGLPNGQAVYLIVTAVHATGETVSGQISATPNTVVAVASATGVNTGYSVTLMGDGTVWAWGYNNHGHLGNNSTTASAIPVQVRGSGGAGVLSGVVAISAGQEHAVALKSDGTVWAWGDNSNGQLGNNSTTDSHAPVQVLGAGGVGVLNSVVAISAGDAHTVALKSDGTVWAWGDNVLGELGNNSNTDSHLPVQVLGAGGSGVLGGVVGIAAGMNESVALKSDGTVWAWGNNGNGQLGNGSTNQSRWPAQVVGAGGVGTLSGVVSIAANYGNMFAVKSDGTVWAWGFNYYGQLGNNSTTDSHVPVQVLGSGGVGVLSGIVAVAPGAYHTVALKSDGTVWAWGWNFDGQLGNNSTTDSSTPVQVAGEGVPGVLSGVVAISASYDETVALKSDGTVCAWGGNFNGELGNNSHAQSNTPVASLTSNPGWLLAPTGLTATPSATIPTISLSWTASPGATAYNIYRSTFSDVSALTGTFLTQVSGTGYNNAGLSDGVLYYYSVTAVGGETESTGSIVAEAVAK